ncbi:MAG: DNA-3-methyladenine glycosylase I [Rothia sp. (in: high G+C Gram-positive bacteria)]|nr:DNA-3-methyladenine glycosylase I [Rothia sp. (in: high G+C Gram-positive bacteria)]
MTTQLDQPTQNYPSWVNDENTRSYFTDEWGNVERTPSGIFEQMCLMTFQIGLTFSTVLKYRAGLRRTLVEFDIEECAKLSDQQLDEALKNTDIIRNKNKLLACRNNARVIVEHQIDLSVLFEEYFGAIEEVHDIAELPKTCAESDQLARMLKKIGVSYCGTTSLCSVAQSLGYFGTFQSTEHFPEPR